LDGLVRQKPLGTRVRPYCAPARASHRPLGAVPKQSVTNDWMWPVAWNRRGSWKLSLGWRGLGSLELARRAGRRWHRLRFSDRAARPL